MQLESVKIKQRDSNIECLRIVAMLLVLIVHADFTAIGEPMMADIHRDVWDAGCRVFFQALSIACVDIFILISGWFGIKASLKGGVAFIFQTLFFVLTIYIVALFTSDATFSPRVLLDCLLGSSQYWFVKSYLLLYILSPVLNAFVNTATREQFKYLLIGYYVFQTLYGWLFSEAVRFFVGGYSVISFIGLYLLARYIRIYRPRWSRLSKQVDLAVVGGVVLILTFIYITPPIFD